MNDILDALGSRLKSPYFGYALLAFIALNWRELFLFVVSNAAPQERIDAFDAATDHLSLVVYPLLVGAAVAASTPWIRLLFAFIARKPLELAEDLQLEAEHRKTIRKTELEQARNEQFALIETELIERAKRDEQVAAIGDDDAKQRIAREIEELRRKRDSMSASVMELTSAKEQLSEAAKELLKAAASDEQGKVIKIRTLSDQSIQAGGRQFGNDGPKDFAKYEAALEQLIRVGYMKSLGNKDQVFELTHDGWEASGML